MVQMVVRIEVLTTVCVCRGGNRGVRNYGTTVRDVQQSVCSVFLVRSRVRACAGCMHGVTYILHESDMRVMEPCMCMLSSCSRRPRLDIHSRGVWDSRFLPGE